jgi:hypothetical protein
MLNYLPDFCIEKNIGTFHFHLIGMQKPKQLKKQQKKTALLKETGFLNIF